MVCYYDGDFGYQKYSQLLDETICFPCSEGSKCNGWRIQNCMVGQKVDKDGMCLECAINSLCDGVDEINCSLKEVQNKNNLVSCFKGLIS